MEVEPDPAAALSRLADKVQPVVEHVETIERLRKLQERFARLKDNKAIVLTPRILPDGTAEQIVLHKSVDEFGHKGVTCYGMARVQSIDFPGAAVVD